MVETARIGGHVFYQMPGSRGSSAMLTARYAGIEPDPASLAPATQGPRRLAARVAHRASTPPPPSRPATFSVWGLDVATVVPPGQAPMIRSNGKLPAL